MSHLKGLCARIRSFIDPASAERRMEEEFAFHVEMETVRLAAQGVPAEEAKRRALARFGGRDRYREEMREGRLAHWAHDLRGDLRYGVRMLWKHRGMTAVALVSLAVGIGANAAIFSLVNATLLRPRAVSDPAQLVVLYTGDRQHPYQSTSYPSYLDFRARNDVFTGLAAYGVGWQFRLSGADDVELVWGEVVSGDYFDVLGVQAQHGRTFARGEDQVPGRNPVVVIGHGLWERRFAADAGVVGRSVLINGQPFTVIGIAPPRYTGMVPGWASEIWVPAMATPLLDPSRGDRLLTSRGNRWVTLVGRLRPGATIEHARVQFDVLTRTMQAEHPDEWVRKRGESVSEQYVTVLPERGTRVHPGMRAPAYALAALLFAIVNVVLLIACMNLAGMLFARAVARRHEIVMRMALGAARSRIIRQLLTESVILSLIAGAAGAVLGFWGIALLTASLPVLPEGIRIALDVPLDGRVVLFAVAFSSLTGILFGLAPALHASRSAVSVVLKDDTVALAAPFRRSRVRRTLVVAQVALSLLLLIGAGLMLRSLENVRPTQLGFASGNALVTVLAPDEATYDRTRLHRFYESVIREVAALPGVQAVSLVDGIPGGFMSRTRRGTRIEGYAAGQELEIDATIVGPRYFTNMGVPIVLGRDFDAADRDGAPCVAIVNEVFAQTYLGGSASALGKHLTGFRVTRDERQQCEIVGIVRDNAWQTLHELRPFFSLSLLQAEPHRMTLIVHTAGEPAGLAEPVRRLLRGLDAGMPVQVETLGAFFGVMQYPFRLLGLVLGACGVLALLLATIGIYGTVAYAAAQRRREVGIRLALGATRADILRLVVGQGMTLVAYGLALGLVLGAVLARALTSMPLEVPLLFGVGATDLVSFGGVTILLGLVALTACYAPARRAARADPAAALRLP